MWTKEYEAHIHFASSTLKYEMAFGRKVGFSIIYKGFADCMSKAHLYSSYK
jgi:hypothetical protein